MGVPWEVVVLAAVLVLNRFAARAVLQRPILYWGVQVINAVLAALVAVFGLPGLPAVPAVRWLVSGLLVFHIVQNLAYRSQVRGAAKRELAERERIRQLKALVEPPPPEEPPPSAS